MGSRRLKGGKAKKLPSPIHSKSVYVCTVRVRLPRVVTTDLIVQTACKQVEIEAGVAQQDLVKRVFV